MSLINKVTSVRNNVIVTEYKASTPLPPIDGTGLSAFSDTFNTDELSGVLTPSITADLATLDDLNELRSTYNTLLSDVSTLSNFISLLIDDLAERGIFK